ncbi:MAG: TIGR00268 family protein [candidate division Zixibacteria bacterium RBG_16_50_21]|nr:MAG: TIGR00268 family protein [candidate division Zixibacteria bacterium RBG_16_50_21]
MTIQEKYIQLQEILKSMKRVVVAFSGGVDSALVLKVAVDVLGSDRVLAVTADSESYPREELQAAVKFTDEIGLNGNHLVIRTEELENPNYAANAPSRCFFCKDELYTQLKRISEEKGIKHILDGCNVSDQGDFRPGREAAKKHGVRSPLIEAGLNKEKIREISRNLGLKVWDKPALACLSSRIPYGQEVTKEKLSKIEQAESYLRSLGFSQLRVRHHENIARVELEPTEFPKFLEAEIREKVYKKFREIGYLYVTLDLQGYRSGSMNEVLRKKE